MVKCLFRSLTVIGVVAVLLAVGCATPAATPAAPAPIVESHAWGGQWIVIESKRDGNTEIYKMRPDGSEVTRLTDNPGTDWWPAWGP